MLRYVTSCACEKDNMKSRRCGIQVVDVKTFPRISKVHPDPKDGRATLTVGVVKKKLTALMFKVKRVQMVQVKIITRLGHNRPIRGQYFPR